jgi:hypothetical protein
MTIPNWLVQLGSLAGLFTFCFTFIDRLLSGRPSHDKENGLEYERSLSQKSLIGRCLGTENKHFSELVSGSS